MSKRKPRMWITYAWIDDKAGDFSYLAQQLEAAGVEAKYDRITLIPGRRRLWEQIADQILKGDIDGWGYLVTRESILSEPCREELAYALDRAMKAKGDGFPIIGLIHGVPFEDVPAALRVRLCVPLSSPNWLEEVKAGLENRPPRIPSQPRRKYVWTIHGPYLGDPALTAIEVRPRFEELMRWRFVVPARVPVVQWGHGPAGGRQALANTSHEKVESRREISHSAAGLRNRRQTLA
jgi:hypothetical protein